jgi:hypothetical protein
MEYKQEEVTNIAKDLLEVIKNKMEVSDNREKGYVHFRLDEESSQDFANLLIKLNTALSEKIH